MHRPRHGRSARRIVSSALAAGVLACAAAPCLADEGSGLARGGSKLRLTGGVASVDGAAGGGLTPWALIGGAAGTGEFGATAHVSRARTQDYALTAAGVAVSIDDRVELSLAQQRFDAGAAVPGARLQMDIVGAKWRVVGDAILDSDRWMPQIALGLEAKRLAPGETVGGVLDSVGARRQDVDLYLSATKLLLAHGVLLNGTLRATRANQNGLLGFGSSAQPHRRLYCEVSVAKLLRRDLAIGAEWRAKPDNLRFAGDAYREDAWADLFVAWAPTKQLSLTAAIVDLGRIVGKDRQRGGYLSAQFSF